MGTFQGGRSGSGGITGYPASLPDGWSLVDGELIKGGLERYTSPDDSEDPTDMMSDRGLPNFDDIDKDGDACISEEEFFEAYRKTRGD